jgi:ribosomal-protein-alanine N-acetyltransferase
MARTDRTRVLLRAPAPGDRAAFVAAMRSSRAFHRPWVAPPTTGEAFDALVRRGAEEGFAPMLVWRRADGALLGFVNISQIIRGPLQSAFVGYAAVAAHAGRGYMTEAMDLALRRAFTALRLHRLEANVQPGNTDSIALLRRCGFDREGFSPRYLKVAGRWRDHERWAIRAEEWRARR